MRGNVPPLTLRDVDRLARQIEADSDLPAATLRARDHAIGQGCSAREDTARLAYWLEQVAPVVEDDSARLPEANVAILLRLVALLFGALAMGGFLLASDRALVNVFLLQLFFVFLPLLLSLLAGLVMLRAVRGRPPAVFPFNPARLVTRRAMAELETLRERSALVRLLMLRYGQEFGALFALGGMAAFLLLLAFTDFSFVWGSTFGFSDDAVAAFSRAMAAPWSSWLPQAVVTPEVVGDTRYHAAQLDLGQVNADSRRGWWPFLFMCLVGYALLPRLLLWLLSRRMYRSELQRSFLTVPGAVSVLARMRSPVVQTQASDPDHVDADVQESTPRLQAGNLLLEWAGALSGTAASLDEYPTDQYLRAGLGSPADDLDSIEAINRQQPSALLVAVKSWEPPMADLADVLADVRGVSHCTLQLVSLPGKEVSESSLRDWQTFADGLAFAHTEVQTLRGTPR